jgi:hypothetical protein
MKVIDYDPSEKIPPIMEKDINSKIIISTLLSPTKMLFLSYIGNVNISWRMLQFRGICFGRFDEMDTKNNRDPVTWSDGPNRGENIIELLINMYKYYSGMGWIVTFIILESDSDLQDFMTNYNLHETPFGSELLFHWKHLAKPEVR